jgi:hypothetical protein
VQVLSTVRLALKPMGKGTAGQPPMNVLPEQLLIPPHEARFTTITFQPTAIQVTHKYKFEQKGWSSISIYVRICILNVDIHFFPNVHVMIGTFLFKCGKGGLCSNCACSVFARLGDIKVQGTAQVALTALTWSTQQHKSHVVSMWSNGGPQRVPVTCNH